MRSKKVFSHKPLFFLYVFYSFHLMVENDFYMSLNLSMLSFYENDRREAVVVAQSVSLRASVVPVS